MFPTIDIGSLHLSTYGILYGLAIIVGGMIGFHRLIQGGIPVHHAIRGAMLAIWGAIVMALLGYGLFFLLWTFILTGTLTWAEGNASIGGLIGGSSVAVLYCRRHGLSLGHFFDLGGLAIPLAQAIGRLGCLAAGCCYGKHTASWLGMCLPDANGVWMLRYPTQLMSSAANLLIFVGLLTFERYGTRRSALTATSLVERPGRRGEGWPFDGFLFLLYLSLFCFKRFSIEFLRGDAVSVSGPFTPTHIACLIVFIVSTALMLRGLRSTIPSPQVAGGQDALYRGDLF